MKVIIDGESVKTQNNVPCHPPGFKCPQRAVKVFRLPEFPPPLAYHYVQNYYSDMVSSLGKAISATPAGESALMARYLEET